MRELLLTIGNYLNLTSMLGTLAVVSVFSWPFLKHPRLMLLVQGAAAASFAGHFALIGAGTAALTSGCVLAQLLAAGFVRRKSVLRLCFLVSMAALFGLTAMRWQGMVSVLGLAGYLLGTLARLQKSAGAMKLAFLASAPFWIVHNVLVGSAFGLAVDVVSLTGNLYSLCCSSGPERRSTGMRSARLLPWLFPSSATASPGGRVSSAAAVQPA
jgi:hypothetical protein